MPSENGNVVRTQKLKLLKITSELHAEINLSKVSYAGTAVIRMSNNLGGTAVDFRSRVRSLFFYTLISHTNYFI
jgi:hypothetical protein